VSAEDAAVRLRTLADQVVIDSSERG